MSDHILRTKDDSGCYYRYLTGYFSVFLIFMSVSGIGLLIFKTEMNAVFLAESFKGSDAILKIFPDSRDHFMNPRTAEGLLKLMLPHFLSYSIVLFTLVHLLRSSVKAEKRKTIQNFSMILIFSAVLDLVLPWALFFGPWWISFFRFIFSFLFFFGIFTGSLLLFSNIWKKQES